MRDVMRWIWDDDTLGVEHAAGMILTAPLPVFMISKLGLSQALGPSLPPFRHCSLVCMFVH